MDIIFKYIVKLINVQLKNYQKMKTTKKKFSFENAYANDASCDACFACAACTDYFYSAFASIQVIARIGS